MNRRPAVYGDVHISPDGRRVLLGGDGLIWDVETGRTVKVGAVGSHVAFSPEGDWVATSTGDGAVVRDVLTGRSRGRDDGRDDGAGGDRVRRRRIGSSPPSIDGTTHEWGVGARRLEGDRGMALAAAASRDGKLVAGWAGHRGSGRLGCGERTAAARPAPPGGRIDAQPSYQIGFTPAGQIVTMSRSITAISRSASALLTCRPV